MFSINDDLSIYVTRGDSLYFTVTAQDDGTAYVFQAGDVVRLKVFGKKDAENVVLQKDFPVTSATEKVAIYLTEEETRIGGVISKPTDYWYEVELNPWDNPQTIIGYDEDGAKIFKLFPEGNELPDYVPDPEDIPVVDVALDLTSTRPVQNQAIARAVAKLDAAAKNNQTANNALADKVATNNASIEREVAVERARIDNLLAGGTADNSEVVDIRVGADGMTYDSAGTAVRTQFSNMAEDVDRSASAYMVKPDFCFDNKWINEAGEEMADNNYAVTRIMDLANCTAIKLRLYQYNNEDEARHLAMIAYYDENFSFVSALTEIAETNGIVETAAKPPDGARYAIASVYKPMDNGYVKFYYSADSANAISKSVDLCSGGFENGYINTGGAVVSDENWAYTDYIAVTPGELLSLTMHGHDIVNTVSYYDANKIYVGGIVADIEFLLGATEKFKCGVVSVPDGVSYMRLCWRISDKTVSKCLYSIDALAQRDNIKKNEEAIKYLTAQLSEMSVDAEKFLIGKTVFLAGDSRASTDYDFYGETMQEKSGANVIVGGASGWKTAAIATNAYFTRLTNNAHDFSLWLVGGNDTGEKGSVGTFDANSANGVNGESVVAETDISADYSGTTFVQAVDHIMRKYKALFYDWRTLDNGHKPKMIFCTDIPQKRSGGETTWSLPENWERKRNAIIECCEKNNVACLDLYGLCNFDMDYEPEWTSPTDMVNNNGLYYMDGLHPNKYGIDIITSLEIAEMRKYLTIH